jgi:hypothetical protein
VFDVRGNSGGNSYWGNQILRGLYGDAFYEAMDTDLFDKQYVEWRVSPDNIKHVRDIASNTRLRAGDDAARQWDRIAAGMTDAQARGERLFAEKYPRNGSGTRPASLFKGKLFLLTDWSCGSACLDFADRVRALPNATHAGRTTNADSIYMEVRGVALPSGIVHINFPTKVYRNRPRGNNEPYIPQAKFEGDMNDTAALESWIYVLATSNSSALSGGRSPSSLPEK